MLTASSLRDSVEAGWVRPYRQPLSDYRSALGFSCVKPTADLILGLRNTAWTDADTLREEPFPFEPAKMLARVGHYSG